MADNRTKDGALDGDAGGDGDSVAQVEPGTLINGSAFDGRLSEDVGKDDAFVDCPDEIENSDSQQNTSEKDQDEQSNERSNESNSVINVQELVAEIESLRDMHENDVAEKERLTREYEEEKAVLLRELTDLCYQLKIPNEQQSVPGESVNGLVDHQGVSWDKMTVVSGASLHEIISECSWLFKNAMEDRMQGEEKVRELNSMLYSKDEEITLLNARVAELSESITTSKHENLSQLHEVQYIEEIVNKILAELYMMHQQDEFCGSLMEKISDIEKYLTVLVERYNSFVSEGDRLRGVMNEVGLEVNMIDEIGTFALARDMIVELGRKEQYLDHHLSNLGDENRKLIEQLEKQGSLLENLNAEIERLRVEVEQEKNRFANTKEKLSMAVTKGKALVQHRDSLKQLLAEKTNELEKCTIELQEKSAALETAQKTKEFVAKTEELASSLQESLLKKDTVLKKCEEILSESVSMEDQQLTDITEKLRWLTNENKSLKAISLQYHKLSDTFLSFDFPETVASSELDARVHWLAESFYLSKEEATRLQSDMEKIIEAAHWEIDHLTTSLLMEIQEKDYVLAELEELRNKHEAYERLQHELTEGREALSNEIDHLTKSISVESQEKSYLQLELENLRHNYEVVVEKEYLASLEKHKIVSMLLEASGFLPDGNQEENLEQSDIATIVDNCLAKIKEAFCHAAPSIVDVEILERFKNLLYITDQEMNLYKLIVEEDILARAQVSSLSRDLEMMTQEINGLKDEKSSMQRSLDQLEDRCALLKEKLSMAVKKGKGLVQERETMKGALNEKNAEIDRLKSELQQSLSKCSKFHDQISKLSLDLEQMALLETEVVAVRERGDQLEQLLAERNSMLQRVMESIEGISIPTGLNFEEPVEKIKWFSGYVSELEILKTEMNQELRIVEDEVSSLSVKLSEAETMRQSLEDALSMAETSKSQIYNEKEGLSASIALLEDELQKERDKASSHLGQFEKLSANRRELEDALTLAQDNISRFMKERDIAVESRGLAEEQLQKLKEEFQKENEKAFSHVNRLEELSTTKRALEDAVSLAEVNVSRLTNERDISEESRVLAEEQLQKLKEELSGHITKLSDAEKTIESLEDALAQSKKDVSVLAEENSKLLIVRADLDSDLKKLKEEVDSYVSKLSDSSLTIQSLEGLMKNAENNIAGLMEEKKNAEQEIFALTSKLKSCSEELSETHGNIENQSAELSSKLDDLHLALKDETLASLLGQCFQRKFESLGNMDSLLSEMWEYILEMNSVVPQNSPIMEDISPISTLQSRPDFVFSLELLNNDQNAVDKESILSHMKKLNDGFHLKSKILSEKCDSLSLHMDESVASLCRKLHMTKDRIRSIMLCTKDLKQQMRDIETDKQRQADMMVSLEGDIRILLSACTNAANALELNAQKIVPELKYILELVKLDDMVIPDLGAVEDAAALALDYAKTAEKLILATRYNQDLSKLYESAVNKLASITEDTQEKMKESQLTCEEVSRERDLYRDRISNLEADLKVKQNFLNNYKEKEDRLKKREEELSTSLSKVHGFEDFPLSASQVKLILDKVNDIEIPDAEFLYQDSHNSSIVRKLFHLLESFSDSQQKVHMLSNENEEMQSLIDTQILEIETLRKQVEEHLYNQKNPEHLNKLVELESSLRNIIRKLGGNDFMNDAKVDGEIQLLPLLDKLVNSTVLESGSLKSRNEELGAKLLGTQKVVDDLSNKIKLLEDSNNSRAIQPEIGQETGISLSTQSEISEMQDVATLGKSNNMPPVPSAAHARTLRKGSNDHLVLNIDSDSERLIDNKDPDEDKGHVFKSLTTTGLIPRQGRTVADRIDGFWVSGSRALMSHPRGRIGVIAYWMVLHIWLLGTIL